MATQKKGGGSNLALIITLVFFVLTTVILGLTTYFGYSEREADQKKVKEATEKYGLMEKSRNWHRAKAQVYRTVMGHPEAKGDAKETARLKAAIDTDNLPDAKGQDDFKEVQTFLTETIGKVMPWDASKEETPRSTYETRLAAKDVAIAAAQKRAGDAEEQARQADIRANNARQAADDAKKEFDKQVAALTKKAGEDRTADNAELVRVRGQFEAANKDKNDALGREAKALALVAKEVKEKDKIANDLADLRREKIKLLAEREELAKELALIKEKSGTDTALIESRMLDEDALGILRAWDVKRRDWRVTALDRTGNQPYINLGSADNLRPQMTFSIHKMGPDNRLVATPKGTLEVVRIIGPHLAQCRLTSSAAKGDRDRNPIVKGDYLFNAQWDPNQKRRVVLAGFADLNETQSDATREFRELLKRQNVELGGWIDANDDKGLPKLGGDGVNKKTDYVIIGDSLDDVKHPRARDEEFRKEYVKIINSQKEKGRNEAIPVISLRRYLQMIGYVPPRVAKTPR